MTRTDPMAKALLLGLAAATITLAGCTQDEYQDANVLLTAQWRQMPAQEENHVEFVTMNHQVAFAPNAIKPTDRELGRMLDFVAGSAASSQDEIMIDAARPAGGALDPVSTARLEILEGELLRLGLPVVIATEPLPQTSDKTDEVTVSISRAVAIPPDCSVPQPRLAQKPEIKTGCANTAALGYMVANPRDLVKGRPIGPGDGETTAKAVEAYRTPESEEGQNQPLVFELTTGGE